VNAHTFGASAISGAKTENTKSATPATTFRLPRSAQRASGTAQSSWATCATKATAPRAASWIWNECSRLVPIRMIPLPKLPGIRAAMVRSTNGAVP
jgi:hypothetical protein